VGLFTGLLLLPFAPVRGVGWIGERMLDVAERESCDPAALRARLADLNRAYEQGDIPEEEFEREEEHLLDLLERRTPPVGTAAPARTGDGIDGRNERARGSSDG
jgi:hypothetical protein